MPGPTSASPHPTSRASPRQDDEDEERAALLGNATGINPETAGGVPSLTKNEDRENKKKRKLWKRFWPSASNPLDVAVIDAKYKKVPYLAALITLLNEIDFYIKHVPQRRMVEGMHCIEYYEAHDQSVIQRYGHHIPESLCKNGVIQVKTSDTLGVVQFILMACAFAGSIPLGRLADIKGRKWPLVMNRLNWVFFSANHLFVYFMYPRVPIKWLYISGIFALQGGNFDTGMGILYASISDIVPDPVDRTSVFFIIAAMLPFAQITPPLGGLLLNLDGQGGTPYVPFLIALVCISLSAILNATLYPETLQRERKGSDSDASSSSSTSGSTLTSPTEVSPLLGKDKTANGSSSSPKPPTETKPTIWRLLKTGLSTSLSNLRLGLSELGIPSMLLLTLAMFSVIVSKITVDWQALLQYATTTLHWSLSKASMTLSIQALVNLLLLSLIIPSLTRLGHRHSLSAGTTSLAILSLSTLFLVSGMLVVGFSATSPLFITGIVIYTLGQAFPVSLQAYIGTKIPHPRHMGSVMSVLSLSQTGGKVVSSLVFPRLFRATVRCGMMGLPFFVAAATFALAGAAVAGHVLLLRGKGRSERREGEEREGPGEASA